MTSAGTGSAIWEVDAQAHTIEGVDAEGRPDPAYAAALGLVSAPFGRRSLAFACDLAIWLMLQLPLWLGMMPLLLKLASGSISPYGFVNHPGFVFGVVMAAVSVVLMLVFAIVQWVLHGTRGLTIGKAATGLRSVNVRTLERPGVGAVLLRLLIVLASALVPLFGPVLILLSPTFDPRGRGWHDVATRLWLVDIRSGLNPYDEKRMRIARKTAMAAPVVERSKLPSLATPSDPAVQPEYRPGSRISAGVLGISRPGDPQAKDAAVPAPAAPVPAAPAPVAPVSAVPAPVSALPAPAPSPAPAPAAPAREQAQAPAQPAARLGLLLDTGERLVISGPILLGRAPVADGHTGARPIAIADTSRSLSKTHALVRPQGDHLELVDCGSTNGCAVIRDGVEFELEAGVPVAAAVGDQIRLGDRTAEVIRT